MARYIQIDEEGYFSSSGLRITDEHYGRELLEKIFVKDRAFFTQTNHEPVCIEAFDAPLVARGVSKKGSHWKLELPYNAIATFEIHTLLTDDWDRFHGRTPSGIPFVFSRAAQMQFFDLLDSFDDESVTSDGQNHPVRTLSQADKDALQQRPDINQSEFWSESYRQWQSTGQAPGWELGDAAKPLREVIPQIKIPKSRIVILGCGSGHDAAFLASQGHIVAAVDLSHDAIEKARALYGHVKNLTFFAADAFDFAQKSRGEFDIVFEHTFFCAIDPDRRRELVTAWRSLLHDQGHLLAIFFVLDRTGGPPFGASEWEIRERLRHGFDFRYWTRWKTSIEGRQGKELIVYAQKKSS